MSISDFEIAARNVLAKFEPTHEQFIMKCVKRVFEIEYAYALTAQRVREHVTHFYGHLIPITPEDIAHALSVMAQAKVLRKRRHSGRVLFEVNVNI
jgi:hypothetical protein